MPIDPVMPLFFKKSLSEKIKARRPAAENILRQGALLKSRLWTPFAGGARFRAAVWLSLGFCAGFLTGFWGIPHWRDSGGMSRGISEKRGPASLVLSQEAESDEEGMRGAEGAAPAADQDAGGRGGGMRGAAGSFLPADGEDAGGGDGAGFQSAEGAAPAADYWDAGPYWKDGLERKPRPEGAFQRHVEKSLGRGCGFSEGAGEEGCKKPAAGGDLEAFIERQGRDFIKAHLKIQAERYKRQFLENARKDGYEITLDDDYNVVSVKKISR